VQEAWRAGRDGKEAYAIWLYHSQSQRTERFIACQGMPQRRVIEGYWQALCNAAELRPNAARLPDSALLCDPEALAAFGCWQGSRKKVSIAGPIRSRAVCVQSEGCYTAPCRCVRPESHKDGAVPYNTSRDVLYSDTPSYVACDGAIWTLAAIVWYSAVLYGRAPYNRKLDNRRSNMPDEGDKKDALPSLKATVGLIIATGVVVSGVWAFFFTRTLAIKDEQLRLVERQNVGLREFGAVPEAVKRLEQRLIPLSLAFPMDPFNGRVQVGTGMNSPTKITMLIVEAEELRKEKKFDLAATKLNEIESLHPDFRGTPYFRFLIEREKGNTKESLSLAEQAIQKLPDDARLLPAYEFAVKANLQNGNKKKAEDLCLTAIRLDPKNEKWREFFHQAFGYEPSIPKE
jgi:tetratricopeptide (TPR) repeat protein